jgi:hypothetical protein
VSKFIDEGTVAGSKILGSFSPHQFTGLVGWWRADSITGVANGGKVAVWNNNITTDSNTNLTQGSNGNRPTLNTADSVYNNQPTVSFASASSQYMVSGTWATALSQPSTIFIVGNDDGVVSTEFYFDGIDSTHRQALFWLSTQDGIGNGGTNILSTRSSTNPTAFVCVFNGVSSALYANARTAVVTGNGGSQSLTGITVGAYYGAADGLNGKIAELCIFNRALSQSEINSILQYGSSRYKISIGQ